MGIFRELVEAEAVSLYTNKENTIKRVFVNAICNSIRNNDEAMFMAIAESVYDDIQTMPFTKNDPQGAIDVLQGALLQKTFSLTSDATGEAVTLNNTQFKELAKRIGLTPLCIHDDWFEDDNWKDIHPAQYSVSTLSEREIVEYFAKGIALKSKTQWDNPDAVYIADNIPENVKANPIANGIRFLKWSTEGVNNQWKYDVERYCLYRKRHQRDAQVYIALEELITAEFDSRIEAYSDVPREIYQELVDAAMRFDEIKEQSQPSFRFSDDDGLTSTNVSEVISLFLKYPRNPWQINKPHDEKPEQAIAKLLAMIKTRREAFIALDRKLGMYGNQSTEISISRCIKAVEDIAYINKGNSSLYAPINTATDDLPMKNLCKMIGITLAHYEDHDMDERDALLDTIGYNLPIASWKYLVENKLLSKDALDYLLQSTRYNEVTLYTNTPYHIMLLCDLAAACEKHYPGTGLRFTDLDFDFYKEDFERELMLSLNAEKLKSHASDDSLISNANVDFLTSAPKI
jgi:hypothetical protein